jgi:hypothetical protein
VIQDVFRHLAIDQARTDAIAAEVINAYDQGRKVLVLTAHRKSRCHPKSYRISARAAADMAAWYYHQVVGKIIKDRLDYLAGLHWMWLGLSEPELALEMEKC